MGEGFRASVDADDIVPVDATTPASGGVVLSRRHSRWLILPSGWMLVVCLFLPAFKFCETSKPGAVVIFPWAYPLYAIGALLAIAAAAPAVRFVASARGVIWLVRASAFAVVIASGVELADAPAEALIATGCAVIVVLLTWREPTEVATAAIGALGTAFSTAWGVLLAAERLAVWGAYVTAVTAGVLCFGCVWWLAEAVWARQRALVL